MRTQKGWMPPIVAENPPEAAIEEVELGPVEAKTFRSMAALANYVAIDRPDTQVAVSVLCQKMSKPTQKSWEKLKRVARYLKKYPVLRLEYREESGEKELVLKVFCGQRLGWMQGDPQKPKRRLCLARRRTGEELE